MSARSTRRRLIWGLAIVVIVAVGSGAVALVGGAPAGVAAGASGQRPDEPPIDPEPAMVKVIHPRQDQSLQVTVHQLATVEAFYQSDLRARVSGLVRSVAKHIN